MTSAAVSRALASTDYSPLISSFLSLRKALHEEKVHVDSFYDELRNAFDDYLIAMLQLKNKDIAIQDRTNELFRSYNALKALFALQLNSRKIHLLCMQHANKDATQQAREFFKSSFATDTRTIMSSLMQVISPALIGYFSTHHQVNNWNSAQLKAMLSNITRVVEPAPQPKAPAKSGNPFAGIGFMYSAKILNSAETTQLNAEIFEQNIVADLIDRKVLPESDYRIEGGEAVPVPFANEDAKMMRCLQLLLDYNFRKCFIRRSTEDACKEACRFASYDALQHIPAAHFKALALEVIARLHHSGEIEIGTLEALPAKYDQAQQLIQHRMKYEASSSSSASAAAAAIPASAAATSAAAAASPKSDHDDEKDQNSSKQIRR